MLMIGNWPKGFPLRSKVIDYLSPPIGKHTGILTQFQTKVKKEIRDRGQGSGIRGQKSGVSTVRRP